MACRAESILGILMIGVITVDAPSTLVTARGICTILPARSIGSSSYPEPSGDGEMHGTTARSRGLPVGLAILAHPPVSPSLRFTCRLSRVLRTPFSLLHHIVRLIRTRKGLLCCTRPSSASIRKMRQPNCLPRTAPSRTLG